MNRVKGPEKEVGAAQEGKWVDTGVLGTVPGGIGSPLSCAVHKTVVPIVAPIHSSGAREIA